MQPPSSAWLMSTQYFPLDISWKKNFSSLKFVVWKVEWKQKKEKREIVKATGWKVTLKKRKLILHYFFLLLFLGTLQFSSFIKVTFLCVKEFFFLRFCLLRFMTIRFLLLTFLFRCCFFSRVLSFNVVSWVKYCNGF